MGKVIWDTPSIELEDVPTLQQLLVVADDNLLLRELVELHTVYPRPCGAKGSLDINELRGSYARALAQMRKLEPLVSAWEQEPVVMFPQYAYKVLSDSSVIVPRLGASAIRLEDFESTCERLRSGCSKLPDFLTYAVGEAFHWKPWREALGYHVWMAGDFSRRERYRVLAEAVWLLTFFGEDPEAQEEAAGDDIAEVDEEVEEIFGSLTHDWTEYPTTHFCRPSAYDLGLEASNDDYDAEYESHLRAQAYVLKERADRDLADRIEHLGQLLKKGYGHTS